LQICRLPAGLLPEPLCRSDGFISMGLSRSDAITGAEQTRLAVIAGNGHFPFLIVKAAREQGIEPVVFAIKEEASPDLSRSAASVYWLSLGEVAQLLELLARERVKSVILAGQVKHKQLYSSITPDNVASQTLLGMNRRNTDALIGAFVQILESTGIRVLDSTLFLKPLLAQAGCLGRCSPGASELADMEYGRHVAKALAALDIGQTVVVADRACLAVEAMEGTDATIERAASLSNGRRLVVVKVSKPNQDMRFDVPVVGPKTIRVMAEANARVLAVDAGKTLLFERQGLIAKADEAGIAVVGIE
jgi:UDP-2,3-diacylglucosamine hydrolase